MITLIAFHFKSCCCSERVFLCVLRLQPSWFHSFEPLSSQVTAYCTAQATTIEPALEQEPSLKTDPREVIGSKNWN